jgi:uncharacterized protein (TIGR03435 family)
MRTVVLGIVAAMTAFSQTPTAPRRQFEVASIKPNKSGPPRGARTNPFAFLPGGRFTATNVTLVEVIVSVYSTRRIQMRGGPDWIDSERFDIVAKADAADGEVKGEQRLPMVQALLEDRFKLAYHRETKEVPVFALVGKPTENLRKAGEDEQNSFTPGENRQMIFRKMPIVGLVNTLANILHEPVVDGTGLDGLYDFTVDPMQFAGPDGAPKTADAFMDLVLTAVREQLGFKLEKRKAPLEIMVIDHAERPEN